MLEVNSCCETALGSVEKLIHIKERENSYHSVFTQNYKELGCCIFAYLE